MATTSETLKNIRTMEQVSYLFGILFSNMSQLDKVYYDLFINPTPMDVELERYDDNGNLVTITIPNRAKDRISTYTGSGSPEGRQSADVGSLYIDTVSGNMYYKKEGTTASGWVLSWSQNNLAANVDFLPPNGSGANLTNLNASNITSGTIDVARGGTGKNSLSGMLKGNGADPISQAVADTDYVSPLNLTGAIVFFPTNSIPKGWLRCDGSKYSRETYKRLFSEAPAAIGTTYTDTSTVGSEYFCVPDLRNLFIRAWDGNRSFNTIQQDSVGSHKHSLNNINTGSGTAHSHGGDSLNVAGTFKFAGFNGATTADATGIFSYGVSTDMGSSMGTNTGYNSAVVATAGKWTGSTSAESTHTHALSGNTAENASNQETTVKNMALVAAIKY